MGQLSFNLETQVWTVTALTAEIHRLLSRGFEDVRVAGEISGYKVWQSGHAYFTLKDAGAQIRCVIFKNALRYMKFQPRDGLAVVARGSVEVRQERGEYQLTVTGLEPQGYGALQLAFEQLKQRLASEGLFAPERKRPLPKFPKRIGIVTSPKGAVIRDLLTVMRRRFPSVHVRLYPVQVQGAGSVEEVCEALRWFGESGWPEVIIVGRGGGSLEDLWTFNEEAVARAIAASPIPVVSAVGHETDFTIADFVADLRAPTPSAAAELVTPNRAELLERADGLKQRVAKALRLRLSTLLHRLKEQGVERATSLLQRRVGRAIQRADELDYDLRDAFGRRLDGRRERWRDLERRVREQDPRLRMARARERLAAADRSAGDLMRAHLARAARRADPLTAGLEALSPLRVLERGYSIVETGAGRILKRAGDTHAGESLRVRLHEGRLRARVEEIEQ